MDDCFQPYLSILESVCASLGQLTKLAQHKIEAVQDDDVMALNEVLNQEQALALALRGLEQKREKLLREMGCADVPLSQLAGRFPPPLQEEAGQKIQALVEQYQAYRNCADLARGKLEHGLREIERTLSGLGAAAPVEGPGYAPQDESPPPSMKTDFRA